MCNGIALVELDKGKEGYVLQLLPVEKEKIRKLLAFGILPGVKIKMLQIYPVYVITVGHTQLALDYEIAKNVIVSVE